MAENKTDMHDSNVQDFINSVEPERRQTDAAQLDKLFRQVTGFNPRMWGPSILGYGSYHYVYDSGRQGDSLATGFSPRKANLVIYVMPGYSDYGSIFEDLGSYKMGKSCLYLSKLDAVNLEVLGRLIRTGLDDLGKKWPVQPT